MPAEFPTILPDGNVAHASTTNPPAKVRQLSTGLVFERHSVDARDLVATGKFAPVLDDSPSIRERLEAMSDADIAVLASRAAIGLAGRPAYDLRLRLVPAIEAGLVVLA